MDGQDSDLPQFYAAQQQHHHRMLSNAGGGQHVSPSPLSGGMHHSVIRPMPNMSMSPTAILQSIGGAAGMPPPPQFHHHMDHPTTTASSPLSPSSSIMMQHGAAMGPGTTTAIASPPEPVKRKRGRPRKYGPDGAMNKMSSLSSSQHQQQHQMMGAPPRSATMGSLDMVGGMDVDAANKKRRGRPPGTGKKLSSPVIYGLLRIHSFCLLLALRKDFLPTHVFRCIVCYLFLGNAFSGSAGTSFTPHIITASPSEDVAGKIAAFATQSPRAVCVLSAMGSVSRVVLRHPADHASSVARAPPSYNNPAIYEGLYEILSLSGSYNLNEDQQNQSDGISVTLCSPERHVIGGVLGGALVAASTVQVVLGSFVHGGSRAKSKKAGKQPNFGSDSLSGGGTDASPSSGHNQNLTPPSVVTTTGGWPSSGIFDTRSSNIDINSSRG